MCLVLLFTTNKAFAQTGKVTAVTDDLVYVSGMDGAAPEGSYLQIGGKEGARLYVIKAFDDRVVTRVLENRPEISTGDQVTLETASGEAHPLRILYATRINQSPKIDGKLDDASWLRARPVNGLPQRAPQYWMPSTESTEVRIIYDNDKIYFGFECYDAAPENVVTSTLRYDSSVSEDDNIQILLDPFNDSQTGVFFFVNSAGAKADMLLSQEGRTRNESWDCLWEAATTRHDKGWTAEVAIPFDQLRFNPAEEMTWGINLGRHIAHKNEEVATVIGVNFPGRSMKYLMSHIAELRGLKSVKRKNLLQIKGYALPGTSKNYLATPPAEDKTFEAGVDGRYGLTANLALDLSYNTDFAQVEADQEQVNLTQFSLFFPEQREFFLEGASLFDFGEPASVLGGDNRPPTLLFYSRRIGLEERQVNGRSVRQPVSILLGSKLTGKAGKTSVGAMHVMTDSEGLADESDFSVLRIKQDVFSRSYVGFIMVNKQTDIIGGGNSYNRTGGIDFSYSPTPVTNIQGFIARTWDKDIGDPDNARSLRVAYNGGKYRTNFSYSDVEDNFEPGVGFVNRRRGLRAFRRYNATVQQIPRPKVMNIRNLRYGPTMQIITTPQNELQYRLVRFDFVLAFLTTDRFTARFDHIRDVVPTAFRPVRRRSDMVVPPGEYTYSNFRFGPDTARYRSWQIGLNLEAGSFYTGHRYRMVLDGSYRPSGRLTIETSYDTNWIRLPPNKKANVQALSARFLYSFTTDFFVKLFTQWNNDSQTFTGNFLLNYRYRPGSDIYLVFDHGFGTQAGDLNRTNRAVLLKVSYLLGI